MRRYSVLWWLRTAMITIACMLACAAKNPSCDSSGGSLSGWLNCRQLGQLWDSAGGDVGESSVMAAIAMAEGGGVAPNGKWRSSQYAYLADPNGTDDEGYWGINSANEGTYYPTGADRYDPMVNAKAAVAIYNAVGLTAWATYNNGHWHDFCGQ